MIRLLTALVLLLVATQVQAQCSGPGCYNPSFFNLRSSFEFNQRSGLFGQRQTNIRVNNYDAPRQPIFFQQQQLPVFLAPPPIYQPQQQQQRVLQIIYRH